MPATARRRAAGSAGSKAVKPRSSSARSTASSAWRRVAPCSTCPRSAPFTSPSSSGQLPSRAASGACRARFASVTTILSPSRLSASASAIASIGTSAVSGGSASAIRVVIRRVQLGAPWTNGRRCSSCHTSSTTSRQVRSASAAASTAASSPMRIGGRSPVICSISPAANSGRLWGDSPIATHSVPSGYAS